MGNLGGIGGLGGIDAAEFSAFVERLLEVIVHADAEDFGWLSYEDLRAHSWVYGLDGSPPKRFYDWAIDVLVTENLILRRINANGEVEVRRASLLEQLVSDDAEAPTE